LFVADITSSSQRVVKTSDSGLTQAETKLLARLRTTYEAYIVEATRDNSISPEFLVALTANESGGDPRAKRFEPGVYRHLKDVAEGRLAVYGSISKSLLEGQIERAERAAKESPSTGSEHSEPAAKPEISGVGHLTASRAPGTAPAAASFADGVIRSLATSWGLTQIMGYHMIGRAEPIERLQDPAFHYRMAVQLLEVFATKYHLDPQRDFEALFRCWNTGRPDGRTSDPAYADRGLGRIALCRQPGVQVA
jgi:hypothetical protein